MDSYEVRGDLALFNAAIGTALKNVNYSSYTFAKDDLRIIQQMARRLPAGEQPQVVTRLTDLYNATMAKAAHDATSMFGRTLVKDDLKLAKKVKKLIDKSARKAGF